MKITAPAKLNLFLHVVGRRADHYHLLESIFVFTKFGDEIAFSGSKEVSLTIDGPFQAALTKEPVEKNLIFKAARLLREKTNTEFGAHIHVVKNIPVSAGLGGGSSDAATTLKALNHFWKLNLSLDALIEIGSTLGADVPACLYQQTAFVSGIGEKIAPISIPLLTDQFVVLVNPNKLLSTQAVFETYQKNNIAFHANLPKNTFDQMRTRDILKKILIDTQNDLENVAKNICPAIHDILDVLKKQPHCTLARMSGSGPTCFALFENQQAAMDAVNNIKNDYLNYWVVATRLAHR